MDSGAYDSLDARLRWLEHELPRLRAELEAARHGTVTPAQLFPGLAAPSRSQAAGVPAQPVAGVAAQPARPALSLETLVAGRGLQVAGLLLVLLGAAYFLELAFSHNWLGPLERVALGLVAGTALMTLGARRVQPAMRYLAEGLIGLGAGILYLALWAAVGLFHLVGQPVALVAMVAVTAALAALAGTRRSERLALLGLAGGFVTPLLLADGTVQHVLLGGYLLVLTVAMLGLALRAGFRWVEAAAFAAMLCYVPLFALDDDHGWGRAACYLTASLFAAVFGTAFSLGAVRARAVAPLRLVLLALDVAVYAGALAALLWEHQTLLGAALLGLAAVLLALTRLPALSAVLRLAYGYFGLTAVTLAVPALLHANALIDAFAVESALLVALGTRGGDRRIALAGLALLGLTVLGLLAYATFETMIPPVLDPLFLAFVLTAGALAFALRAMRAGERELWERSRLIGIASVALSAVVLSGLSRQCIDLFDGGKRLDGLSNHAQLALSLLWTAYASALFALGMRRRDVRLRWQGIVLFGLTIWKVFTVDLAALDSAHRIVSFVGLGIVLVAISAWYQRAFAAPAGEAEG